MKGPSNYDIWSFSFPLISGISWGFLLWPININSDEPLILAEDLFTLRQNLEARIFIYLFTRRCRPGYLFSTLSRSRYLFAKKTGSFVVKQKQKHRSKFFIFGIQIHICIGSAHHESIRKVPWRTRNNFRILNRS